MNKAIRQRDGYFAATIRHHENDFTDQAGHQILVREELLSGM
jgi:hypothetical protein